MTETVEAIMEAQPHKLSWTIAEIHEALRRSYPDKVKRGNASALISSALIQALRAKTPKFESTPGSRGHARHYRLASAKRVNGAAWKRGPKPAHGRHSSQQVTLN
jgi:hypothetical protein